MGLAIGVVIVFRKMFHSWAYANNYDMTIDEKRSNLTEGMMSGLGDNSVDLPQKGNSATSNV